MNFRTKEAKPWNDEGHYCHSTCHGTNTLTVQISTAHRENLVHRRNLKKNPYLSPIGNLEINCKEPFYTQRENQKRQKQKQKVLEREYRSSWRWCWWSYTWGGERSSSWSSGCRKRAPSASPYHRSDRSRPGPPSGSTRSRSGPSREGTSTAPATRTGSRTPSTVAGTLLRRRGSATLPSVVCRRKRTRRRGSATPPSVVCHRERRKGRRAGRRGRVAGRKGRRAGRRDWRRRAGLAAVRRRIGTAAGRRSRSRSWEAGWGSQTCLKWKWGEKGIELSKKRLAKTWWERFLSLFIHGLYRRERREGFFSKKRNSFNIRREERAYFF